MEWWKFRVVVFYLVDCALRQYFKLQLNQIGKSCFCVQVCGKNRRLHSEAECKRTQHCWLTTPSIVGCYMLRPFAYPVACCRMLLRVVAQSLKLVKLFSQQLPTFLLFCDRRSVAKQCWMRLHSSSNTVLLGVVASICTQPNYQYFKLGTTRSCIYSKLQQYFKVLMLHIELLVIWYLGYFLGQLECWRTFCKYGSSPCLNFN